MQMIDVMKRLAELDSKNPNINNPLAAGTKVRMPVQEDNLPQLPDLTDLTELKALSGVKPVAECGMMGMGPLGDSHPPVATFSINATAADGDEVAGMLTQIMNLAGIHKVGPQHMPAVDGGATALTSTPAMAATPMDTPISAIAAHGDSGEVMRAMMDKMNDPPEDEGYMSEPVTLTKSPDMPPEPSTDPAPATPTMSPSTTDTINNPPEDESMGMGQEGDLSSMADEIRSMADELSDMEPEDIGAGDGETDEGSIQGGVWTADPPKPGQPNVPAPSEPDDGILNKKTPPPKTTPPPKKTSDSGEVDQPVADAFQHPMRKMMDMIDNESYDNTPADPNKIPPHDSNKMSWNPNAGGHNKGVMNQPSAMAETLADQLFSDYKKFVAEAAKPSAGMSKGEKSSLVKKAKSGKDIGKPGKSFDKVAKAAGGGEKGKKIAAAAMWKNAAK
jgi:hypothetical protein